MYSPYKSSLPKASKIRSLGAAHAHQLEEPKYLPLDRDFEVEISQVGGPLRYRPRAPSWIPHWTTVLLSLSAALNFAFAIAMWYKMQTQKEKGTVKTLFPPTEWETRAFHAGHIAPGLATDQIWENELTHGPGTIIIDDPASLNLPPGQPYGDGYNRYGVTWAHQYHCLWMLYREFWRFVNNESALVGVDYRGTSTEARQLWHLAHCYDYMREHVVCAMDMSLEWLTKEGTAKGTISGYEVPHMCKKREAIDKYMDEHQPDPELEVEPDTGLPKVSDHNHEHDHGKP